LKADIAKLEAFHMTNQRRIIGILWYEFVTNVEVATLSQLPSISEAISRRRHSLSLATSGVWSRLLLPTKPEREGEKEREGERQTERSGHGIGLKFDLDDQSARFSVLTLLIRSSGLRKLSLK